MLYTKYALHTHTETFTGIHFLLSFNVFNPTKNIYLINYTN